MEKITPRIIEVSQTKAGSQFSCITDALMATSPNDTVYVHPGTYTPTTGERFPLFVPPAVSLIGSGRDHCCIDGQGKMAVSTRPIQTAQSLVLLSDQSSLSEFTITRSGGHGVAAVPLASTGIYNTCIEQNGQHGVFIASPQQAIVRNNLIRNNGTKQTIPTVPRQLLGVARQGHNILVSATAQSANQVIILDNVLQNAFADGIGVYADFDELHQIKITAHIIGNQIESNQRFGVIIAGSFGTNGNQVQVEIQNNRFQSNAVGAIEVDTSLALVNRQVHQSCVSARIIHNTIEHSTNGIFLSGGFGPASDNRLAVLVVGNRLIDIEHYAIRAIAGIGFSQCAVCNNQLQLVLGNNEIKQVGKIPILLQGAVAQTDETATSNTLWANIGYNQVSQFNEPTPVVINNGLP
ncbi:MAG: DUF1565 domain-containing protein, partial [Cyanothece sp. SIO2G6]|nr:DUF1565 domain-containing protein [Cyanothece sp. SIO2G6]